MHGNGPEVDFQYENGSCLYS